jgi:hypothetical protein
MAVLWVKLNPETLDKQHKDNVGIAFVLPGMNPAPIPWILCGPGAPPLRTGDSLGSTATVTTSGFWDRKNYRQHHIRINLLIPDEVNNSAL